ncbi:MAG: ABC transporter ATP-binding protein [Methanobrevibacter sp.]|jgi:ABC-type polysaccharide/polyol phosphate transport system ATPase subunit|nr:ABC transporter ATP-binding protein [Candidatus Methanoflexus mossambicus]
MSNLVLQGLFVIEIITIIMSVTILLLSLKQNANKNSAGSLDSNELGMDKSNFVNQLFETKKDETKKDKNSKVFLKSNNNEQNINDLNLKQDSNLENHWIEPIHTEKEEAEDDNVTIFQEPMKKSHKNIIANPNIASEIEPIIEKETKIPPLVETKPKNKSKVKSKVKSKPKLSEVVIDAKNLSMLFELSPEKIDNIKEYAIKKIKREVKKEPFLALDDVSFKVRKGERLGILGLNGAGKSTLLKIVSGVMKPTKGKIKVKGKIAPLLELGGGFDPNYTGRENIFLNGSILGFSRSFLEEHYDEIAEFSELGRFLDVPLKNYSSGMKAKLGFAVSTMVNPDILILDEVLSVGDAKFKKKSRKKMEELFNSGVTIVMVSHSLGDIRKICDKALWLEKGKIVDYGDAKEICDAYKKSTSK